MNADAQRPDNGHSETRRPPPRYVPTLTEVVELGSRQESAPVQDDAHPPAAPAHLPVDALVESLVERVLERTGEHLAERLELYIATCLAQWRNEQARDWARQWLATELSQEREALRSQLDVWIREALQHQGFPKVG